MNTITGTDYVDYDTALTEANVLTDVMLPNTKWQIRSTLEEVQDSDEMGQALLGKFNDTAYIELAAQQLAKMEDEFPELYNALIQRQMHFDNLAAAVLHIDLNSTTCIPDGQTLTQKKAILVTASQAAISEAYLNAKAIVDDLFCTVLKMINVQEPLWSADSYKIVLKAVIELAGKGRSGVVMNNTLAITSLVGAVVSEIAVQGFGPLYEAGTWQPDFEKAFDKQNAFDGGCYSDCKTNSH